MELITCGLFEGTGHENGIVASVVYTTYPQYKKNFGRDIGCYKDFLLAQDDFLNTLADEIPVHIVRVPFSEKRFGEWLEANQCWRDHPDARGAWAIAVAKDPALFKEISSSQPILPSPPFDERFTVSVYYALAPLVLYSKQAAEALEGYQPGQDSNEPAEHVRRLFGQCSAFKKVSEWRCEGLSLLVGDRLVSPLDVETDLPVLEGITDDIVKTACSMYRDGRVQAMSGVIPVKRAFRFSARQFSFAPDQVIAVVLFLPIALAGSAWEVAYAEKLLETEQSLAAEFAVNLGALAGGFDGVPARPEQVRVVPWHTALSAAGQIAQDLLEEMGETRPKGAGSGRRSRSGGRLKRVK